MKKITHQITLVAVAFLLSQLMLSVVLHSLNLKYFDPAVWSRYDSGHYLAIAKNGYEFFPCAGKFGYPLDATEMCGNTGWFPGYPFIIRVFSFLVKDTTVVGVLISKIFYILSLWMVLILLKIENISIRHLIYLLLPAFFFGFIYYNTIFPISAVLFFSLVGFYYFLRGNMWLTGLCCFFVSFLYTTGFLLSFVFAFYILFDTIRKGKPKRITHALIPLGAGGLGVALVFLNFQIQVGDWSAFIRVQEKYGHGLHNPIQSIIDMIKGISFQNLSVNSGVTLQSVMVLLGFIILSVRFFVKKQYTNNLFLLAYLFFAIYLLFPWIVVGNSSMYRTESLLFPAVLLLKDVRIEWNVSILAILIFVGALISHLFFTSVII